MDQIDGRSPYVSVFLRAVRLVVPWVLLGLVGVVLWSFIAEYRAARDVADTQESAESTPQAGISATEPYVVVLSDGLNLRAEASTGSAVVQVLGVDQQLVFVEEGAGWYHVRTAEGVEGWVAAGGQYTQLVTP